MEKTSMPLLDGQTLSSILASEKHPLPQIRKQLNTAASQLIELFWEGTPVSELVTARASMIDTLLSQIWKHFFHHTRTGIALVAVGGYGRGELHPASDIDILLLLGETENDMDRDAIEGFVTFLWDLGLEIGHSVRTLEECVDACKNDVTVATNLMESRLILGTKTLLPQLLDAITPDKVWPSKAYFEAKWKEQIQRHTKFHDTAYNLEPNIKEGPGGLRDIQMIGWVTKRYFNATSLHELVTHNFLTETEYQALMQGQEFLWKVRFALHAITGRHEDRLLFEHQRTLAQKLGYQDEAPEEQQQNNLNRPADGYRLGVELFMKQYFRTVMELSRLNEMLLQLFQEAILYADESAEPSPINRRFQAHKGFVEVVSPDVFKRTPFALLEIFLILQQNPELKGITAATIRLIRQHRYLINSEFRKDIRARSLFMEIFRQPAGLTHELRRMNRYGILAAYLPSFENIVGQMQYDLFHVYTVDQHTLFVVRNLRRFAVEEFKHEFPLCSHISQHIPKPELLFLAGLFHDIAKGRGGDHSVLGAIEVKHFSQEHGLSENDSELVEWLVKNHLLMSMTAQHRDIDDPEVINGFANKVENRTKLDYLYLLTVADMRGTNPKLWNSWKDALLIELYKQTQRAFLRGLENPMDKRGLIWETQTMARRLLEKKQLTFAGIENFWPNMQDDYFLRYGAEEIAWHLSGMENYDPEKECCLVMVDAHSSRGVTDIFIHAPINKHLFLTVTTALDHLGLNIVEARITSSKNNYCMDTYSVLEYNGAAITDPHRLEEIKQRLKKQLSSENIPNVVRQRSAGRQVEHFSIPTQVSFTDDTVNQRTIMEVVSPDRHGLLSRLAKALADNNINIQNAKVSTIGARVEDVFFITNEHNQPVSDPVERDRVRKQVCRYLDETHELNGDLR